MSFLPLHFEADFFSSSFNSLYTLFQEFSKLIKNRVELHNSTNMHDFFQIHVDVQHFKPEELSVKLVNLKTIVIEGNQKNKEDEQGYISRHFIKTLVIPEEFDVKNSQSTLSIDGVLTVMVPNRSEEVTYVNIPVTRAEDEVKIHECGDQK
ncbi:hypothetical protein ABEB36_007461 [Hypothenemus hampei]|uniref:SHSP domain-containing protein n=1 Tax=Hypothenemus hampei TaxID=57062 RepID=A0ABD1EUK4_HYPHA